MRRVTRLVLLGILLPALARAQVAGQWRDSAHVWHSLCRYCHETTIGPPLLGVAVPATLTIAIVRSGHDAMPAFTGTQISDRELRELADWIVRQPTAVTATRP